MARFAGRNGRVYMGIASGGTAEPIAFLTQWTLNQTTDKLDATAFGDANKTYVAGLPDSQGTYQGWMDNATAQMYTAATDGVARKFYLYPDTTNASVYWFGTAFADQSVDISVSGVAAISGSFAAATPFTKVG